LNAMSRQRRLCLARTSRHNNNGVNRSAANESRNGPSVLRAAPGYAER